LRTGSGVTLQIKSENPKKCATVTGEVKLVKGIVSRDWKGLQMVSFDRFEV
jgi:hypothetical protein